MVRVVVVRHILGYGEPGEEFHRGLAADVERAVDVRIEIEQALVVVYTAGQIVAQTPDRPGSRKVVRVGEDGLFVENVVVICVAVIDIGTIGLDRRLAGIAVQLAETEVVHPAHGERLALVDAGRGCLVVVEVGFVEHPRIDIAVVDDVGDICRLEDGEVAVVSEGKLLLGVLRVFRGDEHHAEGGTGAVNGRRGRILEDGDALDVIGVEQGRIALGAVDEHQGAAAAADGCRTTDVVVRALARLAVFNVDVEVGDGTEEHLGGVGRRTASESLFRHLVDGASKVGFLHGAIGHHHDIVEKLRRRLEGNGQSALIL